MNARFKVWNVELASGFDWGVSNQTLIGLNQFGALSAKHWVLCQVVHTSTFYKYQVQLKPL